MPINRRGFLKWLSITPAIPLANKILKPELEEPEPAPKPEPITEFKPTEKEFVWIAPEKREGPVGPVGPPGPRGLDFHMATGMTHVGATGVPVGDEPWFQKWRDEKKLMEKAEKHISAISHDGKLTPKQSDKFIELFLKPPYLEIEEDD